MTDRLRLANRRTHETIAVEMLNQRFKIGLGRHTETRRIDGTLSLDLVSVGDVAEVFINAQRPNSDIDVLCSDAAILMSLLLQCRCPIETIQHAMKKDPDGKPSSPLGFAAQLLTETTEANHGHSSTAEQT